MFSQKFHPLADGLILQLCYCPGKKYFATGTPKKTCNKTMLPRGCIALYGQFQLNKTMDGPGMDLTSDMECFVDAFRFVGMRRRRRRNGNRMGGCMISVAVSFLNTVTRLISVSVEKRERERERARRLMTMIASNFGLGV